MASRLGEHFRFSKVAGLPRSFLFCRASEGFQRDTGILIFLPDDIPVG